MKKLLLLLTFIWTGSTVALAQLPNGSTAPNFTVTDIDGNTHTLYDLLDDGKTVYLDVFATWCVPCWNYHNTHALRDIWEDYGPNGTNEAFVISIEGDASTSVPCIWDDPSCTGGTTGDWTAGTPYPIADYSAIMSLYQVTYYPTIFMVCPADKKVYVVGQQSKTGLWNARTTNCPPLAVTTILNNVNNTTCSGSNTGDIDISASGGTGPFTYAWSNGANTQDLINVPAGTYECTVTNAQGWTGETGPITVDDPPTPLTLSLVETTPMGCNGIQGSITVDAGGGWSSSYTYNWNNGMTGTFASPLNAGTYTCSVTDDNGCTVTLVTVLAPASYPVASIAPPGTVSCLTPTVTLTSSATGGYSGIYEYNWFASNGGNFTSGTDAFQATVNAAGNYTVQISDAVTTCTGFSTVTVTANINLPTAEAGPAMALTCVDPTTELEGSGSTGNNFQYAWTAINGGHIVSGANTLNPVVDSVGNYILKVTNTANGCIKTDTTGVTANTTPPTTTATGGVLTCVVVEVGLTSSTNAGNPGYAWAGPNGFTSNLPNPTATENGDYVLTVTDSLNGCTNTATAVVAINTNAPGAGATGGTLNCLHTSIELSGTSPVQNATFAWTGPNGFTSASANPTVSEVGEYNVVATDPANGCTSTALAAVDQNIVPPTASATTPGNLNCTTTQLVLDGTGSSQGSNIAYAWTTANGHIVSGENTASPTVDAVGTYDLVVTNTDNGCTAVAATQVIQSPVVTAAVNNPTNVSCNGGSDGQSTVTPGGGNSTYTYAWSNGETTVSISNIPAGNYTVVVTDGENCTAETTVTITQPAVLLPNASTTPQSASGVNDGTATSNPTGGTSGYTYAWSNGETTQTIIDLAPGNYTVTVTDANGCTAVRAVTVNAFNCTMATNISGTAISCFGANNGTATVSLTGANDPVTYAWSNGGNTQSIEDLAPGTYTVDVIDATNCASMLEVTINEPAELQANASATGETFAGANDGTATAAPSGGTAPYTYAWSNGEETQTIANLAPAIYTVIITDANGCTDVQSVVVNAFNCAISAQAAVTNASCPGLENGIITLTMNGGAEPYTYAWSNGATTDSNENLAAGTYTATVTDANDCLLTQSYTIGDVDNTAPVVTAQNTTLALNINGTVSVTMQTLSASASDNCNLAEVVVSPNSFDCSELGAHPVTISATDASGNNTSVEIVVTIVDNMAPTVNCPASIRACWYDNTVSYDAPVAQDNCLINGGEWKLETGLPSGSEFPVGETTQTYSFTDASGNKGICSFTVTITSPVTMAVTSVKHDVGNQGIGAIDINVSGGDMPYSFVWTDLNGTQIATTEDVSGLYAGTYFVKIRDANGCILNNNNEGIVVDNTSGTAEPTWLQGVSFMPNPTTGLTQVVFANPVNLQIEVAVIDATGRLVLRQQVDHQNSFKLDCTGLPQGAYTVRFRSGTDVGVRKLMVVR